MKNGITIFTPTYNRSYRLSTLYESLCKQSCREFEWVVVDDGSTDDTKVMIKKWQDEHKIIIRYFWQENAGKAQAYNLGVEVAERQLFLCVDSDDFLLCNAVEKILDLWERYPGKIGIICARLHADHELTTRWNGQVKYCTLYDAYRKYGLKGETVLIYQTDIIKKFRFPRFQGEKFVTEAYLYDRLDQEGVMYITDEAFYVAEYLPDGYTKNSQKIVEENPYGFLAYIEQRLRLDKKLKYKIIDTCQYIVYKRIVGEEDLIEDAVYPILTWVLYSIARLKNIFVNSIKFF